MPNTADYLNQLIDDRNDLADNLVTMGVAASHSETFTELVPKVLDISGGGNIGYQVTFKVNGDTVYIASCEQGESISRPPLTLVWTLNGVAITFPYTPNADVELVGSTLPIGYTALNYIETSGTQYINTGVVPYNIAENLRGYGIKCYNFVSLQTGTNRAYYFGCCDTNYTGNQSACVGMYNGHNIVSLNSKNTTASVDLINGNSYYIEAGFKPSGTYLKFDDTVVARPTTTGYIGANAPVGLGQDIPNHDSLSFPASCRFGETIITTAPIASDTLEGTTKLRHLVPCLDDSNVPCMYDIITQTTFYNAGTGTFLYG